MKVYNIGNGEVELIDKALVVLQQDQGLSEYDRAHARTTLTLMKDMRLQELCEVCLSYFWDRLKEEGVDNPDVEYVADMIGVDEEELKLLFKEAGYEED